MKRLSTSISPVSALVTALILTVVATTFLSDQPGQAVIWLLTGPIRSPLALGNLLAATSRLLIAGLGAAIAFRAGSCNLGGEGQALLGGLAAAGLALMFPGLPRWAALPLAIAVGSLAGASLGGISGLLKASWDVDERISTFLLAAAVAPIGPVLLGGPMKDADSYLIAAPVLPNAFRLAHWWPPSRLGIALLWSLTAAGGVYVFLHHSHRGYEWRMRGTHETFARYAGIRTGRITVASLALSGGFFGLAGTTALLDSGQAIQGFTTGLGWNGLAVALIAATRPELVPLAALAYAWLIHGTRAAMMHTTFSFSLSGLVQGAVLLLVTAQGISRRKTP